MKEIRVGLLGFGTVGKGFFEKLKKNSNKIENEFATSIKITDLAVNHLEKYQNLKELKNIKITNDYQKVIENPEINLIIEVMGGFDEAYNAIKTSLINHKNVITANKEVLGKKIDELQMIAKQNQVNLYFEASVAGEIPIIKTLEDNFKYDQLKEISGILNGTSNYVLTKMTENNVTYDEALITAQKSGYAESDPSKDVLGFDVESKLKILYFIYFNRLIEDNITVKGINEVSLIDLNIAEHLGHKIKLIGSIIKMKNNLIFEIRPKAIPKDNYFFNIDGVTNAVKLINHDNDTFLQIGPGAGMNPTAQSVFSDLISFLKRQSNQLIISEMNYDLKINHINLIRKYLVISKNKKNQALQIDQNKIEKSCTIEGYYGWITKPVKFDEIKKNDLIIYPIE